jgi:hypothetical protein
VEEGGDLGGIETCWERSDDDFSVRGSHKDAGVAASDGGGALVHSLAEMMDFKAAN